MATVYKPTFTKPLPPGAEIITRKGERLARWKDAKGKTRTALVTVPATGKHAGQMRIIVESACYVAKYRDGGGVVRVVPTGCRDETAARGVLAELVRRAELVKGNVVTAAESAAMDHADSPLIQHVEAYVAHLTAAGVTDGRIAAVRQRLTTAFGACGFTRLADMDGAAVEQWLVGRQAEGASAATRNAYRSVCVAFGNWCVSTHRLTLNPFGRVPRADEKADPRRKRRSLTEDELRRLLGIARRRPLAEYGRKPVKAEPAEGSKRKRANWTFEPLTLANIAECEAAARVRLAERPARVAQLEATGRERALIYKTLVLTGLRKAELASVTVGQLDLGGAMPHIALDAADEKNREGNSVPLRGDLVADLSEWLADKLASLQEAAIASGRPVPMRVPPDSLLFNVPDGLLRIMDRDLVTVGIARRVKRNDKWRIDKRDERGRTIDVHALRTTFGTLLSKGGVMLRTAQAAMRHSDPKLTANVYTDPKLLDVAGALDALPSLPLDGGREAQRQRATGTTDASPLVPPLVPTLGESGTSGSLRVSGNGTGGAVSNSGGEAETSENGPKSRRLTNADKTSRNWAMRGSNPQPHPCKGCALAN